MVDNIKVFKQNSIRIEGDNKVIYIDPFEMEEAPHDASFVLITHDHYDHFSPEDIEKAAGENTVLVVPEKMENKAKKLMGTVSRIVSVKPGASYEAGALEFETVPMYNILKPFHPKGALWCGYVLKVDGRRIYIAGDIDAIKEAKAVKCDIALIPIGGFYTMDAKQAAELVNAMQPTVAIPVHYGELTGKPEDGRTFAEKVKAPVRAEIKIKF